MKTLLMTASVLAVMAATPAFAENVAIENALKSRNDLTAFYQALVNTGVNQELRNDVAYTVFAPNNDAFAELTQAQYPCFYESACRGEVADIVRNHIVVGEVNFKEAVKQKGGLYSLDDRFLPLGATIRNNNTMSENSFSVDGNDILATNEVGNSVIFRIDGVIANDRELGMFQYGQYAYVPAQDVMTTVHSTSDDGSRQTTTTRTVTTPVLVY